eukprot:6970596-Prymnesium_polylepis.1
MVVQFTQRETLAAYARAGPPHLRRLRVRPVVPLPVLAPQPRTQELEGLGRLELRHHVPRAADGEEVEALVLVARHVAAHGRVYKGGRIKVAASALRRKVDFKPP